MLTKMKFEVGDTKLVEAMQNTNDGTLDDSDMDVVQQVKRFLEPETAPGHWERARRRIELSRLQLLFYNSAFERAVRNPPRYALETHILAIRRAFVEGTSTKYLQQTISRNRIHAKVFNGTAERTFDPGQISRDRLYTFTTHQICPFARCIYTRKPPGRIHRQRNHRVY